MINVTDSLFLDASERGVPLGGTFELTPLCNFNCKMCYIRMSAEQMKKQGRMKSVEEWLNLARRAKEAGMLFLLLTGGEPLLYPGFRELYGELKKMGFFVSINSNGALLSGENLELLVKNPPYRINITLYGGSDETYRELCGCENGFSLVTEAVKKLKAAGVYVKLNGSITPFNCKDIDFCFDFARTVEAPLQLGTYMFPPVRREDKKTGRFGAAAAGKYQAIIDKKRYSPEELENKRELIDGCLNNGSSAELPAGFRCRAGRSTFWVNWKGEMTPCGMTELFAENPFELPFDECWARIKESLKNQPALSECVNCEKRDLCKVCPVMAYSETGDLNKKPEYICRMTDEWAREMMSPGE